jgi:hypothetical protein
MKQKYLEVKKGMPKLRMRLAHNATAHSGYEQSIKKWVLSAHDHQPVYNPSVLDDFNFVYKIMCL